MAVVATTATEAEQHRTDRFDAAFVDLRLGGADGWQLIARLRQQSVERPCPIVVVSGLGDPATRARSAGEPLRARGQALRAGPDLADGLRRASQLVGRDGDAAIVSRPTGATVGPDGVRSRA